MQATPTQPAATTPRTITITGMTGEECVQKVRTALKKVSGVTTESVTVGEARVVCAYPAAYAAACSAITSVGYRVGEPARADAAKGGEQMANEGAGGAIGEIKPEVRPIAVENKTAVPVGL